MSRAGLELGLASPTGSRAGGSSTGSCSRPAGLPVEAPEGGRALAAGDVGRAEAVRRPRPPPRREAWGATGMPERVELVERLGARLRERRDALVELIVLESGKTLRFAAFEVDYALLTLTSLLGRRRAGRRAPGRRPDGPPRRDRAAPGRPRAARHPVEPP